MRIAITGASGLVGKHLTTILQQRGDETVPLVRGDTATAGGARWQPNSGEIDTAALGPINAVVHLAGENVASDRWSQRKKQAIFDSRVPTTTALCATLAAMKPPPRVLVSASAVGIYGDRGDEELDERSASGDGFLADTARQWEEATAAASAAGIRVVNLRIGVVLSLRGGALQRMLTPFRLGIGGRLGAGRQWMSWITLDDLCRVIAFCVDRDDITGPVLAVAPEPATNREFTKALGRALRRPTLLPAPAPLLRLALGEMADALLLSSQRARPQVLASKGFAFRHPELGPALTTLLAE